MVQPPPGRPSAPSPAFEIDVDCARIARQLKHSARRTVGLLPASAKVDVRPFTFQLALAMSQLCRALIVVIDPMRHWPLTLEPPEPEAEAAVGATDSPFFAARYLDRAIALVAPHEIAPPGAKVEMLQIVLQTLESSPTPIAIQLLDMSGFARLGEFLSAVGLLDGVITVAESRTSKEDELLYLASEIDPELNLGVIVTA